MDKCQSQLQSDPSESAVRRKAKRRNYGLCKFRDTSGWFNQYGPYALFDERNIMHACQLTLRDACELLDVVDIPA